MCPAYYFLSTESQIRKTKVSLAHYDLAETIPYRPTDGMYSWAPHSSPHDLTMIPLTIKLICTPHLFSDEIKCTLISLPLVIANISDRSLKLVNKAVIDTGK
jgi:hypothetical protein